MKNNRTKKDQWEEIQTSLAEENALAVILVDEKSTEIQKANNNSICEILYSSENYSSECAKFCGKAFEMANNAGKTVEYQCYAGLNCSAVPVKEDDKTRFVAIVGRAFTKSSNYREAAERTISGDWKQFPPTKFFENVLIKSSLKDLEAVSKIVEKLDDEKKSALINFAEAKKSNKPVEANFTDDTNILSIPNYTNESDNSAKLFRDNEANFTAENKKNNEEIEDFAVWRSQFGSLFNLSYNQASQLILDFISTRYSLKSLAWAARIDNHFLTIRAEGKLKEQNLQINISADDKILKESLNKEIPLKLQSKNVGEQNSEVQFVQFFPIAVAGEIRGGLILGDETISHKLQRQISRFCQNIALELEVLRLREEISRRGWLERAVQKFNENLNEIDSEDFWFRLTQISAELMRAERSSLLIFDEKSDELVFKAAIGSNADSIKNEKNGLGSRVARQVMESGNTLVVEDINKIGLKNAPTEWNYKTQSFICYPLSIGKRKIGVLNLTDKTDGEPYNNLDLQLLNSIMPQLAVLIDRATLKHKAGEFEQLSVTDALTGLLNRRYLEERLAEEIKRSNRHGFPMSFMMIDVDDFKSYNDNFSHPEGDKALKLVAHLLKETLRGADVAARYGGEEFSILLPQTTSDEAKIIAERIREKVEATEFPNRRVTISLGIASCSQVICNAAEIISAADKALYKAKEHGRNNVQIFEEMSDKKK